MNSRATHSAMLWEDAARQLYNYIQKRPLMEDAEAYDTYKKAKQAYDEAAEKTYTDLSV